MWSKCLSTYVSITPIITHVLGTPLVDISKSDAMNGLNGLRIHSELNTESDSQNGITDGLDPTLKWVLIGLSGIIIFVVIVTIIVTVFNVSTSEDSVKSALTTTSSEGTTDSMESLPGVEDLKNFDYVYNIDPKDYIIYSESEVINIRPKTQQKKKRKK